MIITRPEKCVRIEDGFALDTNSIVNGQRHRGDMSLDTPAHVGLFERMAKGKLDVLLKMFLEHEDLREISITISRISADDAVFGPDEAHKEAGWSPL